MHARAATGKARVDTDILQRKSVMAEAGKDALPTLGGRPLSEDHAALWLAVLELLSQLQRKTGAGRGELLQAVDAAMTSRRSKASNDRRARGRVRPTAGGAARAVQLDCGESDTGAAAGRAARLTALGLNGSPATQNCGNLAAQLEAAALASRGPRGPGDAAWEVHLARLAAYKVAHGDCSLPWNWAEDPRLARWVSMQRHLKRKLDRGESSEGMTAARVTRLTALGLVWDPPTGNHKEGVWEDQLARLAAYKVAHSDCNVPRHWAEDPPLGQWVSTQRHLKRKLDRGESSEGMTAEWAARLEALGFS